MITKIQNALQECDFDAVLLTSENNRRYATGFHSTAGVCFITKQHAWFATDFRYIEAAKAAIEGAQVQEIHTGETYSQLVRQMIATDGVKKVALEDQTLTFAEYESWQRGLQIETCPMRDFMNDLRLCKTETEIENIIKAQRIAEKALTEVLNDIKCGATEKQIAARLTYRMLWYGAENMSFDPIVVSGANSSKPHGVPSDKQIEDGDFVTMDFGCIVNGYCSDMTRTVAVGHCTEEMQRVYHTVLQAQKAGIAVAKAGLCASEVDSAGRQIITEAGWGDAFGHGFGHGVGLYIHEAPNASPRGHMILRKGMILTAEPGIYLPGKFGVRIEDMLLIQEKGCRNLTNAPKELMVLPA